METRSQKSKEIQDFIIHNVSTHRADIARLTANTFGLSRVAIVNRLRSLVRAGILTAKGKTKARQYELELLGGVNKTLHITPSLHEDEVWLTMVKPQLEGVKENVLAICAHGFTEMLNNVLDHSESTTARVAVGHTAAYILLGVRDHGVGIFNKVQKALNLSDPHHAILELTKGKLTTDKEKHTGEGIFFTSRMFDQFVINSGTLQFTRNRKSDDWLLESDGAPVHGTEVLMNISTNATHTVKEIFDEYRAQFDQFGFSKTIIPLILLKYEGEHLISRSQAKRLLTRVEEFREVVLDFKGITSIGQAFADEVFRIYRREHPSVHIRPIDMTGDVIKMIQRITSENPQDPLNQHLTTALAKIQERQQPSSLSLS